MTDADRLFVPLTTEHYQNFAEHGKEWELRGQNHLYNEETVLEGRAVELRRGYSTDDSLWGTIADVRTFESLVRVADVIGPQPILPGATRAEFLESATNLLGDYDSYIAFHVPDATEVK